MAQVTDNTSISLKGKRVFVAGHMGMLGSSLIKRLQKEECGEILTVSKKDLDLRCQEKTYDWITKHKPEIIFLCAAKVGGIAANDTYRASFIYDNLMIAANVIHSAFLAKTQKLLYLGSSCIYPKNCQQPIEESSLLSGSLEPTNEAYAIAKLAGIKLCQAYRHQYGVNFIVGMPTSLYGPGDNFDLHNSHVIPALIRKVYEAKQTRSRKIAVWGTGQPRREFLYVDDCADALVFLMKFYSGYSLVNIGYGSDISIAHLAKSIISCVGFDGEIEFDTTKPDGTSQKLLSSKILNSMGWTPSISLEKGLNETYRWFVENELNRLVE